MMIDNAILKYIAYFNNPTSGTIISRGFPPNNSAIVMDLFLKSISNSSY